jgi:hypothetical protein
VHNIYYESACCGGKIMGSFIVEGRNSLEGIVDIGGSILSFILPFLYY